MEDKTIQMNLFDYFMDSEGFSIQDATELVKEQRQINVNDESIRARIYEGVDAGIFTRVSRGVYKVESQIEDKKISCLLVNGNGRNLSFIEDESIDSIITVILMIYQSPLLEVTGNLPPMNSLSIKSKTLKKRIES